jgi:hypothetical protein
VAEPAAEEETEAQGLALAEGGPEALLAELAEGAQEEPAEALPEAEAGALGLCRALSSAETEAGSEAEAAAEALARADELPEALGGLEAPEEAEGRELSELPGLSLGALLPKALLLQEGEAVLLPGRLWLGRLLLLLPAPSLLLGAALLLACSRGL